MKTKWKQNRETRQKWTQFPPVSFNYAHSDSKPTVSIHTHTRTHSIVFHIEYFALPPPLRPANRHAVKRDA